MNTKVIFVLILVVIASYCEAKKNGGGKKCKPKALCPKVEELGNQLNLLDAKCQANDEDLQKQIDDLANELEELKNRPPPTIAPTTEPPFVCDSPWVEYESSCYLFANEKSNWAVAVTKCDGHGAKLLSIKSQGEQNFVQGHLRGDSWLGMSDDANEGSWVFEIDGSAVNYAHWNGGEPNGGRGENKGMIWANGGWNDCNPNYNWYYVCQKP